MIFILRFQHSLNCILLQYLHVTECDLTILKIVMMNQLTRDTRRHLILIQCEYEHFVNFFCPFQMSFDIISGENVNLASS